MKSNNLLKMGLGLIVAAAGLLAPVNFAMASATAGAPGANANVQERVKPVDGNGHDLDVLKDIGYKIYVASATTSLTLVTDEGGTAPKAGLLHMVCRSVGANTTDSVVVFDSATASGLTANGNGTQQLGPPVQSSTTLERCETYDAEFHYGLVMLNSVATGASWVYWRPIGGRK